MKVNVVVLQSKSPDYGATTVKNKEYRVSRRKEGGEFIYSLEGAFKLLVSWWPQTVCTSTEEGEIFNHDI